MSAFISLNDTGDRPPSAPNTTEGVTKVSEVEAHISKLLLY
jgi:hypothetical protein